MTMNSLLPQLNRLDSGYYQWVQIYRLTRDSVFMTRGEVRREAIHRYRSEVEDAGYRVASPCEVQVLAAQQLVKVHAIISSPSGRPIKFEYTQAQKGAA